MTNVPQLQFPVPRGVEQYEQYRKLSQIALKMQQKGIRVDREALERHRVAAQKRLERFRGLWEQFTGVKELGADGQTAQVKAWFWDTMQLPKVSIDKKTKKPKLDTNGALMHYLTEIEDERVNKAAAALIGYRKAAKGLDYCKQYAHDRVYPSFNVTGTKGSRWSCSGPNIQQLPSKDVKYDFGDGPELVAANMKDIIIPDDGYVFVGSDYSALEVYLQAYLAGDKLTLKWINEGWDLHLGNARLFFDASRIPRATTIAEDRAQKKTHKKYRDVSKFAFGMCYNVTDHVRTTWKQMHGKMPELTEQGVKKMRSHYFRAHPELIGWQKRTIEQVNNEGFIELGLLARRLYLEPSTRGHNQGMNSQCQTLAGDMLNEAVLATDPQLSQLGARIVLTWHDSIILEVPNSREVIVAAGALLTKAMSGPFPVNGLDAMFVAEPDYGPNLKDMDALKV